jgi:AcrR family transcriptional regulator
MRPCPPAKPPLPPPRLPTHRTRVLDAAEAIVRARGVPGLTLEAAAREAGVSKGGLLYQFRLQGALLSALLTRLAEFVSQDFAEGRGAPAARPRPRRARDARLGPGVSQAEADERCDRAAAVFLAAFHHDPRC